jgi:glycosyltransferase involved in cell wall biosynthesis
MVEKGIQNLDITVAVDSNIYNYINRKNYKKIKVLYNSVDTNFFKKSEAHENKELKVLIPRNLNPARGVFLIPKVAYYLKQWGYNVEFGIVGTGPTKKYIEKMIKKYNLSKEIILLGHIGDRVTIRNLYLRHDVVIIPTVFSEGTSLSALEAMAVGKLVLMTNVGGLKEIGVDMLSKVVIKKNSLNIAEKIRDIIDKKVPSDYISKNGCKHVNEKHNLDNWQEEWFSILNGSFNK